MSLLGGWGSTLLLGVGVLAAGGCATAAITPTYSQAELRAECARPGGWWHPDGLIGGFCEHNGQM